MIFDMRANAASSLGKKSLLRRNEREKDDTTGEDKWTEWKTDSIGR